MWKPYKYHPFIYQTSDNKLYIAVMSFYGLIAIKHCELYGKIQVQNRKSLLVTHAYFSSSLFHQIATRNCLFYNFIFANTEDTRNMQNNKEQKVAEQKVEQQQEAVQNKQSQQKAIFRSQPSNAQAQDTNSQVKTQIKTGGASQIMDSNTLTQPQQEINEVVFPIRGQQQQPSKDQRKEFIPKQKFIPTVHYQVEGYKKKVQTQPHQFSSSSSKIDIKLSSYLIESKIPQLKSQLPRFVKEPILPYRAVGLLTVKSSKSSKKPKCGTAFVLLKNYLVTAAHVVCDMLSDNDQKVAYFTPFAQKDKTYTCVTIKPSEQYLKDHPQEYFGPNQRSKELQDFAILEFIEDLQQKYGSFSYNFNINDQKNASKIFKLQNIKLLGYVRDEKGEHQLAEFCGDMLQDQTFLYNMLGTSKGVSGGPILYIEEPDIYWLIGIHIKALYKGKKGVLLSKSMFQHFQKSTSYQLNSFDLRKCCDELPLEQLLAQIQLYEKDMNILRNRKYVNLEFNKLTAKSCTILKENLNYVQTLNLSNNQIGDEGCQNLTKDSESQLQVQFNSKKVMQPSGLKAKIEMKQLKHLFLYNNLITEKGCKYLSGLQNLQTLKLSWNPIGHLGCIQLAKGRFHKLKKLFLSHCDIGHQGIKQLIAAPCKSLQEAYLSSNEIGDKGCELLAQAQWPNLRILNLSKNEIENLGCEYLSKAAWNVLQELFLAMNKNIDAKGCQYLAQALWPNLKILGLHENSIKEDPKSRFFKNRKVKIEWNAKQTNLQMADRKSSEASNELSQKQKQQEVQKPTQAQYTST